ncbi:acyl carrier protein [bacterium]|nr:acyl carrier protein [bacterium]
MQAHGPAPFLVLLDELAGIATQHARTEISLEAPLMLAGFGALKLSTRLNERLETELPSTLLFDHPSLRFIAGSLEIDGGDSIS